MRFFKGDLGIDFMGIRKWAILASLIIIIAGIASMIMKGGIRYGVDFTGGTLIQVKFNKQIPVDTIRESLKDLKLGELVIQQYGPKEQNEFILRLSVSSSALEGFEDTIKEAFRVRFGTDAFEIRKIEMVGPKAGKDLREKALWAVILGWLGIMIYVWWRYDLVFSVGGIIALVHDVLITLAFFSFTNREISLTVIAALLTIIGWSINDTIVIYDRIRENMKTLKGRPLQEIMNISLNQTLSRTIITSLDAFLVVFCLYAIGGAVINDFAFAMMVGIIAGTYSSIYIASPVTLFFHNFFEKKAFGKSAHKKEMIRATAGAVTAKGSIGRMIAQEKQATKGAVANPVGKKKKGNAKGTAKTRKGKKGSDKNSGDNGPTTTG